MIEEGILTGVGLLVTLAKLKWPQKMWIISHPVLMDIIVFIALLLIHWGTFSGVMIATFSALTVSVVLSAARKMYGKKETGSYVRGWFDISGKLA